MIFIKRAETTYSINMRAAAACPINLQSNEGTQNVGKIEKVAAASKVVATCPEAVEARHTI
jgi:hypothetical protein